MNGNATSLMRLCVIPARGGSKRIPRKNIRSFGGKPMIVWSIEAAVTSTCFDQVIVSTEDPEIEEIACSYGVNAPFRRPIKLADDHALTTDVVRHAIEWYVNHGIEISCVCCIYATAPFIDVSDIQLGCSLIEKKASSFIFTVAEYPSPIQRALLKDPGTGRMRMWQPEQFQTRSQDLETGFYDAGQFYWGTLDAWMNSANVFQGALPIILPSWRVQDIDTEDDWKRAEIMHKVLEEQRSSN